MPVPLEIVLKVSPLNPIQLAVSVAETARILKREDKWQMTSQYGHGFLSIFFGGKYELICLKNSDAVYSIVKIQI